MTIPTILTWIALVAILGFVARPGLSLQWVPMQIRRTRKMRKQ
jgi:hypothetical protein